MNLEKLNFINILSAIGSRDITFILIGILIGIMIGRKVKFISLFIKNPVESIITTFILFIVVSQFFTKGPVNNSNSFDILNFISNVILAWIMTKYSVKNDYEEKSKEMASISYSYSLKCEKSIDFGINICDLAEQDLHNCTCNNSDNCRLNSYIHRVKDNLISAKNDIKQNTLNWGYKISTEINHVQRMSDLANEISDLEGRLQTLDPNDKDYFDKSSRLKSSIKKNTKQVKLLNNSMNNEIRLAIENAITNQSNISQLIAESFGKEGSNKLYQDAKNILKPRNADTFNSTQTNPQENSTA